MIFKGKLGGGRNRRSDNLPRARLSKRGELPKYERRHGGGKLKGCAGEGGSAGKLCYRSMGGDRADALQKEVDFKLCTEGLEGGNSRSLAVSVAVL